MLQQHIGTNIAQAQKSRSNSPVLSTGGCYQFFITSSLCCVAALPAPWSV